jgi:ABC-2 type transport system ATP-binding protein
MIEVSHLVKRHGSRAVVDDVSFTATTGRVTGFLGPNGAGKSSTLRSCSASTGLPPAPR